MHHDEDEVAAELRYLRNKLAEATRERDRLAHEVASLKDAMKGFAPFMDNAETKAKATEERLQALTERHNAVRSERDRLAVENERLRAALEYIATAWPAEASGSWETLAIVLRRKAFEAITPCNPTT
jgi:chromosome segregation ATPase